MRHKNKGQFSRGNDVQTKAPVFSAESLSYRRFNGGMSRALLKLAKRSLPMIILRDFELLVNNSIV